MYASCPGLLWLFLGFGGLSRAQDLTVSLDYGTFQGAYVSSYNISYWQKIPFAAPPVGENRFRAPQPPTAITNGTYNSSQTFDMCPQRTVNGSEDCLYLGLYSRPWTRTSTTSPQNLRPVIVAFFGGGFIQGSAAFGIPPSAYPILNASTATDLVFVYANYRTNAFGFLPGRQVMLGAGSDANAGLRDQEAVLRWVRRYGEAFGGDAGKVTVWGQSAGGGSVLAQVVAARGREARGREGESERDEEEQPLFHSALASSPFWPKTYDVDAPEAQWRYDMLANLTRCGGAGSLKCLKSVDVQTIRDASLVIAASHQYTTSTFEWGPVVDGTFMREPLSAVTAEGRGGGSVVDGFAMYNTHEGESFLPAGLKSSTDVGTPAFNSSAASFDVWLRGYLPRFGEEDYVRLKELYPAAGSSEAILSYNDGYTRAGLVYRDSVLACPGHWMAGSAAEGGWMGEYTISPALHASDVYWWNTVNAAQHTDPLHYKGYAGAMASFFMTGDPNALKLTAENVSAVPSLETGTEWTINSAGFTTSRPGQFKERCDFWRTVAPKVPI